MLFVALGGTIIVLMEVFSATLEFMTCLSISIRKQLPPDGKRLRADSMDEKRRVDFWPKVDFPKSIFEIEN